MSDSEIAELCRRIYRRHKQALDLIFEYRPDLQWDIAELLKGLVEEHKNAGLVLDHTTKRYVRFALTEWDDVPALRSGRGWTPSGRLLLFEFENKPNRLTLYLIIGPGPDALRQTLHETALRHPKVFRGALKRLYSKWTMIYKRPFLRRADYKDPDSDALTEKIRKEWAKFLADDLPAIRNIINGIEWPPVE